MQTPPESDHSPTNSSMPREEDEDEPLVLRPAESVVRLLLTAISPLLPLAAGEVKLARTAAGAVIRRVADGITCAVCACMVLMAVLVVAAGVGVGVVRLWAEEPVFVREPLHFDYTEANPSAIVSLGASLSKRTRPIPAGHKLDVSVLLVMPESDFNLHIGMFQIRTEAMSSNVKVIARSSRPCMLRFRSLPVRLARIFMLGIPFLLGISDETQTQTVSLLKYKEGQPKTEAIVVSLLPRAGSMYLPELYRAEIIIRSELPWRKNVVHMWKWAFYLWTTFFVYILLLVILACWLRPLIFHGGGKGREVQPGEMVEWECRVEEEEPDKVELHAIDMIRSWHRRLGKRKAELMEEAAESSAFGITGDRKIVDEEVEEDTVAWEPLG